MNLRSFSLLAVFCLALTLLGCGGGGGGSNPTAAYTPVFDTKLDADYPTVAASYRSMQTSLLEDNTKTEAERVGSFMPIISDNFVNSSNVPAKDALRTATLDRLTRYKINTYTFVPTSHTLKDNGDIEVTTYMAIDVTRKPDQTGGYSQASTELVPGVNAPKITWRNESGTWRIIKGLPYLSSEISF